MSKEDEKLLINFFRKNKFYKEENGTLTITIDFDLKLKLNTAIYNLLNAYKKEKEKNKKLKEDRNYLLIEGAKSVAEKDILKQTFKDSTEMFYIHKNKIREIIIPRPDNPIPIEIQQSDMYKKLMEELNNE